MTKNVELKDIEVTSNDKSVSQEIVYKTALTDLKIYGYSFDLGDPGAKCHGFGHLG